MPNPLSLWSGFGRLAVALLPHLAAFGLAYGAATCLRFDFVVPAWMVETFWSTLPAVLAIKAVCFGVARQYRAWWGHISFADLPGLCIAATASTIAIALVNQLRLLPGYIPRGVQLVDLAATLIFVGGLRSLWRFLQEQIGLWWGNGSRKRAILVGASHAEKIVALHLNASPKLPFHICGYLDETSRWRGQSFGGVPVLGTLKELEEILHKEKIGDVLTIAGSLPGRLLRDLRARCDAAGRELHILPPLAQLARGNQDLVVKPIDVERLLRRPIVCLDEELMRRALAGATVAVTGAGGSIGSEVCRQLHRYAPRRIVLVERSEPSLFEVDMALRRKEGASEIVPFLGDVTDAARMRRMFEGYKPDWLFHVAAHKHVPMLESHAGEAVKNNLFGTANLVELADEYRVERFVFVSTDKAVNPSSVMGATKRLAENYVMAMAEESSGRYVAVRFGNVLASAGSVVPLFEKQIRRGGPITITHPDMQRYFMTISEAARLVLQAACVGQGGEIFVLDMGEPIRIVDLARDMIRMSGLPEQAIEIDFVGMRPGEKLHEELYFADEEKLATPHPKLFSARHRPVTRQEMLHCLADFRPLLDGDDKPIIQKLARWAPEYTPGAEHLTPLSS